MRTHIIFSIATAGLLSMAACNSTDKAGNSGADSDNAPSIDVARAITDSVVIYHTYPGTLNANNTIDVVARVSGTILSQNYESGQLVKKGQLLFQIEDTKYRDAVSQAEAALATARSSRTYAEAQYSAMKKALESDAVSLMEVNKAKSSLEQADAAISNALAQLQTARTNLSYCRVTAPTTGHISANTLSVGAFVDGEAAPVTLATVYEDATLYAKFHIDDKAMQDILLGNSKSKINLDSIPLIFTQDIPQHYYGKLSYVSPQVDKSTGTLELNATVSNPDGDLHDGMYVNISLPSKSDPHAILVKDAAISTDQLGKYLYTVNDSMRVVYTPIRTGDIVNDSMRVVVSGIAKGTPYVTTALLKVRDGMKIKPVYK